MKLYLILLLSIYTISCSAQRDVCHALSDILYKKQTKVAINKFAPKALKKNRDEIKWIENINLSLKSDTIFLLEAYNLNVESGILYTYAVLWDSTGNELSYECVDANTVKKTDKSYFSNYMKYLISSWNVKQLREEEKIYKQVSGFDIYATRIIFSNNKYKVDCISFINFANFEKEQEFQ